MAEEEPALALVAIARQQLVHGGAIGVQPDAKPMQQDATHAVLSVEAGVDRRGAAEQLPGCEHPAHRIVLHRIPLEARRSLGRHQRHATDCAARRDDDLISGPILIQRVREQRAYTPSRFDVAPILAIARVLTGIDASCCAHVHNVTPSSPTASLSAMATAADEPQYGAHPK